MEEPGGAEPRDRERDGGRDGETDAEAGSPEIEATLAVVSESPAEVTARITALDRVGDHLLEWRGEEELRDVYLDTPDGGLRERGLALRLRRGDAGWTLTLKGEARPAPGGGVERSELEVPWSGDGWRRVFEELRRLEVAPPSGSDAHEPPAPGADPVEAVRAAGLQVVQERRTLRRTARVLPRGDGGREPVAHLVVDTVRYRPGAARTAIHREVEVEAAERAPDGLPGRIAARLRDRFGDELRPWEHGKLATGVALEDVDPPVGRDGDLLPDAYALLDEELGAPGRDRSSRG